MLIIDAPWCRLLVVNQERSQLKARSAAAAGAAGGGEAPAVEAMVEAKRVVIAQLKEKVEAVTSQVYELLCSGVVLLQCWYNLVYCRIRN